MPKQPSKLAKLIIDKGTLTVRKCTDWRTSTQRVRFMVSVLRTMERGSAIFGRSNFVLGVGTGIAGLFMIGKAAERIMAGKLSEPEPKVENPYSFANLAKGNKDSYDPEIEVAWQEGWDACKKADMEALPSVGEIAGVLEKYLIPPDTPIIHIETYRERYQEIAIAIRALMVGKE